MNDSGTPSIEDGGPRRCDRENDAGVVVPPPLGLTPECAYESCDDFDRLVAHEVNEATREYRACELDSDCVNIREQYVCAATGQGFTYCEVAVAKAHRCSFLEVRAAIFEELCEICTGACQNISACAGGRPRCEDGFCVGY